jgi:Trypsin
MRYSLLSLYTLVLATACQASDEPALGSAQQAIVHGEVSDATDDASVFVRTQLTATDGIACTGTLIAPNLVVTALHCVTTSEDLGEFSCRPDGSLSGATQADGKLGPLVTASKVQIFTGASIGREPAALGTRLLGTGSNQVCRGDLAFVVLDRDVDIPISPIRLSTPVRGGQLMRVVGYGQTETNGSSGRFARNDVRVIDVGPSTEDQTSVSASPRTFVVDEGPCHGDSGGPAFTQDTHALVGVYSLTAGASCEATGIRNVYTNLSLYSSLALDAFAAAGAEPVLDEVEAPEAPAVVGESGCSLGAASSNAGGSATGLLALGALGVGLIFRRRG